MGCLRQLTFRSRKDSRSQLTRRVLPKCNLKTVPQCGSANFPAIDFTQLALTPQGGHINHLTLDGGYATLHVIPQRNDEYLLSASGVSLAPHGKTEFRTDLNQDHLRVEVFSGHVQATDSNQSETLAKEQFPGP